MLNDVDYLLMAKPVTFNLLGIRHDCATLHKCYRLLVVLSEGHDFCCCLQQDEMYLKFVRPGNKAAWLLTSTCQVHSVRNWNARVGYGQVIQPKR